MVMTQDPLVNHDRACLGMGACSTCGQSCVGVDNYTDWLYNLEDDPREENNLIHEYPDVSCTVCVFFYLSLPLPARFLWTVLRLERDAGSMSLFSLYVSFFFFHSRLVCLPPCSCDVRTVLVKVAYSLRTRAKEIAFANWENSGYKSIDTDSYIGETNKRPEKSTAKNSVRSLVE